MTPPMKWIGVQPPEDERDIVNSEPGVPSDA